ncbi:polysaccharide deacetylase family protein [Erythrobacter sp. GH1-10]|uniref:polysaccharide deacetylase family protein n=1 Tax=Erythrobacter sp. GH1-10 TaxID=3349334 RepID=UPI0038782F9F
MATASMLEPPAKGSQASFASDFGQRVLLTVDTEEEFDWEGPFTRDRHGLDHVAAIPRFQAFCEEIGAHPVYLVDWPIVQDARSVEIIGDAVKRGTADIGVQLHPWVNPPFEEEVNSRNSYAGNLPRELEAAKFRTLRDGIEQAFGKAPLMYRAGRYGLGEHTAELLKDTGIAIDTSVRSLFDYSPQHGADYTHHPLAPYWVDEDRSLLELPVTSVYWGVLRQLGKQIQRLQRHVPTFYSALSKFSLLERIALTPEGVTSEEALRGIDIALDDGLPLLVLSFHSPSLAPGFTPYVRTEADLERLYEWFRTVYAYLDRRGVRTASVADVIAAVER